MHPDPYLIEQPSSKESHASPRIKPPPLESAEVAISTAADFCSLASALFARRRTRMNKIQCISHPTNGHAAWRHLVQELSSHGWRNSEHKQGKPSSALTFFSNLPCNTTKKPLTHFFIPLNQVPPDHLMVARLR
jgi:hypothetical protein